MRSATLSRRHGAPVANATIASADVTYPGYWPGAFGIVVMMMALVGIRVHEFFPFVKPFKPVFTLTIASIIILMQRSTPAIRKALARQSISRLVYLYFAFMLITIPFAMWQAKAFEMAQGYFPAILLFAAFSFCPPTRQTLDRLQFAFVGLVLFFAAYLQVFNRGTRARLVSVSGTFDSNDVAAILAMGAPLAIGILIRANDRRERIGAALAVFALAMGAVTASSRGGIIALLAGLAVFVLGLRGGKRFGVLFALILVGTLFWTTAPDRFRGRVRSITNLENDYNTTDYTGRKAIWRRARIYIRENPVWGVGAGCFFVAEGGFNAATGMTGKWSATHNAYLQALSELGIPGGSVFILMLLTAAGLGLRMWGPAPRQRGPPKHPELYRPEYLASLAAFCSSAYFLSHAYFTPVMVVIGLIALSERVRMAEREGGFVPVVNAGAPQPVPIVGERGGLAGQRPHHAPAPVYGRLAVPGNGLPDSTMFRARTP